MPLKSSSGALLGASPKSQQQTTTAAAPVTGADAILRALEREGVEVCFGIPGGAILPLYDALARGTSLRHVLACHEQGAGHMAEAYARATGRPGVVFATSGPGATNLVTPIADARMDSTPLVCVTGQVSSGLIGTQAFQECDIVGVTEPLVKGSWLVRDPAELAETVREAYRLAGAGRPGPVLVDVPRDVQEALVPWPPAPSAARPRVRSADRTAPASADAVRAVARAIEAARRPVLYVGGGAVAAEAGEEVAELATAGGLPVVTTLMAKGVVPESHPLNFGCPGMHGGKWANWALNMADLVIAVGARFDDRVTGRVEEFAPAAKVAHFDVDPAEIGKIRHADFPVLGDLRDAVARTRAALAGPADSAAWVRQVGGWQERFPLRWDDGSPGLKGPQVLEHLAAAVAVDADLVWTTGVGQHQMWAMQYLPCERPRSFLSSGGHGTMGFGLPAAIGARAARPDATVVCVDGDGSFLMTCQELGTAVAERLPVIVVVLDNGGLGMVRQWQEMFYDGRLSQVRAPASADIATVARGFGARAFTVRTADELRDAFAAALACGETCVLDVKVTAGERLYPMIEPGSAAVDVLEHPGR
ncbi:MAG: biosynthetic-type acetolactate synthase large subunit [Actinobacteria bacterium]|nr:biosynthetic-type acetolactate synthase large subunit [Actinomycetota bacterium]